MAATFSHAGEEMLSAADALVDPLSTQYLSRSWHRADKWQLVIWVSVWSVYNLCFLGWSVWRHRFEVQ